MDWDLISMTDQNRNFWAGIFMCLLFCFIFFALLFGSASIIAEKDREIDRLLYKQYLFQCEFKEKAPNPDLDCDTFSLCNQLNTSGLDGDLLTMKCFEHYQIEF